MRYCLILFIILFGLSASVTAYKVDEGNYTHQYITYESHKVWPLIPQEIKNHLNNPIDQEPSLILNANYDSGNDIITGSAEEDGLVRFLGHFWNSDVPDNIFLGDYNYGFLGGSFDSSYRNAVGMWDNIIIPKYQNGDVDEAYYYLGRVAHLLEDAAQPSHLHDDPHFPHEIIPGVNDGSVLESWAGNNIGNYDGADYVNDFYRYNKLIENFDWSDVDPQSPLQKRNLELFRLFWYTAQKTQYWASDDVDGNTIYYKIGDYPSFSQSWDCSGTGNLNLWAEEGYTSCSSFISDSDDLDETTVEDEADAVVPHAMKATAALYQLFWDAVHTDWRGFQNTNRRTGFNLMKGDITSSNDIIIWNYTETAGNAFIGAAVIAEVDDSSGDQGMELIVARGGGGGRIYALDGDTENELWSNQAVGPARSIAIEDLDNDGEREVITADLFGTIWISDSQTGATQDTFELFSDEEAHAMLVENIDNQGFKEIIVSGFGSNSYNVSGNITHQQAYVYALDYQANLLWTQPIFHGSQFEPASADIDDDGYPEIIISTFYRLYALAPENDGEIEWELPIGKIWASPTIADLDNDGTYEIIVVTGDPPHVVHCFSDEVECHNQVYVIDHNGNIEWNRTIAYTSLTSPAVANLDNDDNLEFVFGTAEIPNFREFPNSSIGDGIIYAYDGATGDQEWTFIPGGKVEMSPSIADTDNDGELEIIFGAYDGLVYIIDESGTQELTRNFNSIILYSNAIGDLDGDGMAEIVVKHAGGVGENATEADGNHGIGMLLDPANLTNEEETFGTQGGPEQTIHIEIMSGTNSPPILNFIPNITVNASQIADLNESGNLSATDPDNDTVTLYFSAPFNATTAQWQTTLNDSGIFEVLIEASDGNLSDTQVVIVTVINEPPTAPQNINCNGQNCSGDLTVVNLAEIMCVGSSDNENNTIVYEIDAYYNHTGYNYTGPPTDTTSTFTNNFSAENLTFEEGIFEITRYLSIPLYANVTHASLTLTGHNVMIENQTFQDQEDAAWQFTGECDPANPCTGGHDELWDTFASSINDSFVEITENFTIPSTAVNATIYAKGGGGGAGIWITGCREDNISTFHLLEITTPESPEYREISVPQECFDSDNTLTIFNSVQRTYPSIPVGSIYYESKILWLHESEGYPTNPSVQIGTNGTAEAWNYTGIFNTTEQFTNIDGLINNALNNEACDCQGCSIIEDQCFIPFTFVSETPGIIEYSEINITYDLIPTRYAWNTIGAHVENDSLLWNTAPLTEQSEVNLRCRAIDPIGSNTHSEYLTAQTNITLISDLEPPAITFITPPTPIDGANITDGENITIEVSFNKPIQSSILTLEDPLTNYTMDINASFTGATYTIIQTQTLTSLSFYGFESGEQGWTDPGVDSFRFNASASPTLDPLWDDNGTLGGDWVWHLRDGSATSHIEQSFDFTGIQTVILNFSAFYDNIELGENLTVLCDSTLIWDYDAQAQNTEGEWINHTVQIRDQDCIFDNETTLRFQTQGNSNADRFYLDGIHIINATIIPRAVNEYNYTVWAMSTAGTSNTSASQSFNILLEALMPVIINFTNLTNTFNDTLLEFQLLNNLNNDSFAWNLDFGDGTTANSEQAIVLENQDSAFILIQHEYATSGNYTLTATAGNGIYQDTETLLLEVI